MQKLKPNVRLLRKNLNEVADFLLPRTCVICGSLADEVSLFGGTPTCKRCLSQMVPVEFDRRWLTCLSEPFSGDPHPDLVLYMPFSYDSVFQKAIHKLKFERDASVARILGTLLGELLSQDEIQASALVPIPLSLQRLKERGFNQAEQIAVYASKRIELPVLSDVLSRTKNTAPQAQLTFGEERFCNVKGAFSVNSSYSLEEMVVILVDDIATTGSTLHEAASALLYAGCAKVLCCALSGNRNVKNAEPY